MTTRDTFAADALTEAVIAVLQNSRGMPIGHIQARLTGAFANVEQTQLRRVLRAQSDVFQPVDRAGSQWRLNPLRARKDPTPTSGPRVFQDVTPPLRNWQHEALTAWAENGHQGIIQAITGAGKSLVGIVAIRDAAAAGLRTLVLVPTTPLIGQWEQSLRSNLPGIQVATQGGGSGAAWLRNSADVVISTVHTAANQMLDDDSASQMLLVADEAHHYAAATFRPVLRSPFTRKLGLTATLQRSDGADTTFLQPMLGPIVFELGYARALKDKVVAPFDVQLIGVPLNANEAAQYAAMTGELDKLASQLRVYLPETAESDGLTGAIRSLAGRGGAGADLAKRYIKTLDSSRDLLDVSPGKIMALENLAPAIKLASGTIVFTQTVALARAAALCLNGQGIRTATLTAEHSHDERAQTLARFAHQQIDAVIAPQLLDEGIDVPEANLGIVLSASRTRRQMVQRMGRVIRPKQDGSGAKFCILFSQGTREDPKEGAHDNFLDEVLPLARRTLTASSKF